MTSRTAMVCTLVLLALFTTANAQPAQPASEDSTSVRFQEARALWEAGELARAVPIFEQLLEQHIDHATAPGSAQLLLDSLNRLQRYEDLERWVERLLSPEHQAFLREHADLADTLHALARRLLRKRAETQERARDYTACGNTYLDAYNRFPSAPDADELLYNAAICLHTAGSVSASIRIWQTLIRQFPRSRLSQMGTARLAHALDAVAMYDQAAEWYETYARLFGGERDAVAALERAIELRFGLGQWRLALESMELFAKQYARKRARAYERLVLLAVDRLPPGEEPAAVARLLIERYLKTSKARAGGQARVVLHARLGELLWQLSCAENHRGPAQGCVREVAEGRAARCETGPAMRVLQRDGALADKARRHFQIAVESHAALARDSAGEPGLRVAADRARAKALFYLSERDYEAYLALAFPSGLSFEAENRRRSEDSRRRFETWLTQKRELAAKLAGGGPRPGTYQVVVELGTSAGPWSVAAAARVAQIANAMADSMLHAEIPANIRRGRLAEDKTQAYCQAVKRQVEPMQEQAVQGFRACAMNSAVRLGEWQGLCRRVLESLRPALYPRLSERHGAADQVAPVLSRAPPVFEYPSVGAE